MGVHRFAARTQPGKTDSTATLRDPLTRWLIWPTIITNTDGTWAFGQNEPASGWSRKFKVAINPETRLVSDICGHSKVAL